MEPWFQRQLEEMVSNYASKLEGMLTSRIDALKQDVRSDIADLRRNYCRVPGRNNNERATGIMAATVTATVLSTPAASHVFPDPKRGPDLVSSTSSTTRSTRPLRVSSSGIPTEGFHESEVAASSSNFPPAAAATGISVSTATSAAPASCGVTCLIASATTRSTSPGGDTGVAPDATPPVSTGPIGVPASIMQSKADQVLETPVNCSTLGLYPAASAIQVKKTPMPVMDVSPMAPKRVQSSFSELVAPVVMPMTVPALTFESSTDFELSTLPPIGSRTRPDHNNRGEDPTGVSLTPCSASLSLIASSRDSPSPQSAPWDVHELVTKPPNTCLTNCPGDDTDKQSLPESPSTYSKPSRLMPAATPALTVQLQRQVWVSPSMVLVLELLEASKQLQCKRGTECSVGDILVGVPNEQNGRACYHLIPSNQKGKFTYKYAMVDQAIRLCSNRLQALLYLRHHVAGAGAIILQGPGTWCESSTVAAKG